MREQVGSGAPTGPYPLPHAPMVRSRWLTSGEGPGGETRQQPKRRTALIVEVAASPTDPTITNWNQSRFTSSSVVFPEELVQMRSGRRQVHLHFAEF